LRFEAAILSRTRSPTTSRSNWAKESKNVEREPAHAGGGVEGLGDRHEGHAVLVEQLDQLGEVGERAGETVDLIDDHDADLASPDIGQKPLQGWAVERGSGETAIVVAIGNQAPALMRLALDIGLAGLALGIERVEFEIYARSTSGYRSRSVGFLERPAS
jgi:hypothetical protein